MSRTNKVYSGSYYRRHKVRILKKYAKGKKRTFDKEFINDIKNDIKESQSDPQKIKNNSFECYMSCRKNGDNKHRSTKNTSIRQRYIYRMIDKKLVKFLIENYNIDKKLINHKDPLNYIIIEDRVIVYLNEDERIYNYKNVINEKKCSKNSFGIYIYNIKSFFFDNDY
jgi:hypothetical protein